MLAKALAAESKCYFINVTASAVMSKWFGDANRFIRAIFTLAAKLQPAVIFIDEVDAFLTRRGQQSEHEATLQAKTEFMQLWDGMEGARGARVLVMGATNRPWMVDEAVLRRFALQYEVGLPAAAERAAILRRYLLRHEADMEALRAAGQLEDNQGGVQLELLLNTSLSSPPVPNLPAGIGALDAVAAVTQSYSGSDLMELAAQAAQNVLVEYWAAEGRERLRQISVADLIAAAATVQPSVSKAQSYSSGLHGNRSYGDVAAAAAGSNPAALAGMAQLMAALAASAANGKQQNSSSSSNRSGNKSGASGLANGLASRDAAGTADSTKQQHAEDSAAREDGSLQQHDEEAQQDEMYKMVGKLVMSSLGGLNGLP
eukprot:GHRR01001178.1.p1 GENE.GHRR01001178.1~~GHRR01001178.1.p1  ORF type:complete len:373 (+),score=168.50 GHRR01001178.1:1813-2931(+)